MELWRLAAHRHWVKLKVLGREVKLCARCTGYVVGFLTFSLLHMMLGPLVFNSLDIYSQQLLCILLITPLMYDWLSQSWGWRESNNSLRLLTGAIFGMGVSLFSSIEMIPFLKRVTFVSIAVIVFLSGFIHEFSVIGPAQTAHKQPVHQDTQTKR